MTAAEVKEWLEEYGETLRRAYRAEETAEEARQRATSIGARIGDGMPHARGGHHDLSDVMERIEDAEAEAAEWEARARETRAALLDAVGLAGLDALEIIVIRERYLLPAVASVASGHLARTDGVRLRPWAEIAEKWGQTESRIYKIHGRALDKIARAMDSWGTWAA